MATVFIPSMLRPLADGRETVEVSGSTVGELVGNLVAAHPELAGRLLDGDSLRSNISVAIDGEVSTLGLLDAVGTDAEVHFIPAIAGGRGGHDANALG